MTLAHTMLRGPIRLSIELRVRADDGVLPDHRGSLEHAPWFDPRVLADLDPGVDVRGLRISDGHPGAHVPLRDLAAHQALRRRELDPIVDAHGQVRIRSAHHSNPASGADRQRHQIGQVELALGARRHVAHVRAQPGGVEAVGAHVDLVNRARIRVSVRLLHDGAGVPGFVAQDPAVPRWIRDLRAQEGNRRFAFGLLMNECLEQLGGDQRCITHRDQDLANAGRHTIETHPHGIRGAQLRVLLDARRAGEEGLDLIGTVADHHDPVLDSRTAYRVEDVTEDRTAGERVEDLGKAGTHPRPLAGGQDDGRGG